MIARKEPGTSLGCYSRQPPGRGGVDSGIKGSKHSHMRELRIQHKGDPYRIFYAFNPLRTAILLLGGNKVGNDRFYDEFLPIADSLYEKHLAELKDEGVL